MSAGRNYDKYGNRVFSQVPLDLRGAMAFQEEFRLANSGILSIQTSISKIVPKLVTSVVHLPRQRYDRIEEKEVSKNLAGYC
jgi:hypothetical protein